MDAETLSRIQFAFTASFHFIYPPLSMGLGIMLVVMGIASLRTRDPKWRQLSFFWTKIYGLIFAMGVATGIVQEFEFGMNWANYSRFVGNVFGSLLAAEGIFAFFLEGGFLGLMLFGGTRLGPRLWLGATCMVVFAAHFSAVWILMANSWMQTPDGYTLSDSNGVQEAHMSSFVDVMFTPSFLPRLLHVFAASWTSGTALVLSVSAYYILRNRHVDLAKSLIHLTLPLFAVLAVLNTAIFGANQAIEVTDNQQVKLASMEGVWNDKSCAPMFIVGWVNEENQTTKGISIPCLLSYLAYQNKDAVVKGLNSFPQDEWPNINLVFQVYHLMIDLATYFSLLGIVGVVLYYWKRKLFTWRWVLWLFVANVFLTETAIIAGWWTAETGRQPWIVWQLLKTEDAVSPALSTAEVATSLTIFVILYALLLVLFIFLLNGFIKRGPAPLEEIEAHAPESVPETFREIFRHRKARASAAGVVEHSALDTGEVGP
jgi:cytochrome bd ubiquinol oxidase subunit I